MRHLNVTIGEHIGTLPLPKKEVKPEKMSVADHLPFATIQHPMTIFVI